MDSMSGDKRTELAQLLATARNAGPMTRIDFRNPISAHGGDAVPALAEWLRDPKLAALASASLQRIAHCCLGRPRSPTYNRANPWTLDGNHATASRNMPP
jgi:hypothetical protein